MFELTFITFGNESKHGLSRESIGDELRIIRSMLLIYFNNLVIGCVVIPTNDVYSLSTKHCQLTGKPKQQFLCAYAVQLLYFLRTHTIPMGTLTDSCLAGLVFFYLLRS